jgi:hypothetical protein
VEEREGTVKPEFSEWYPALTVGTWYPAIRLRETVLSQLRSGEPTWQSEDRVPSDAHFWFRGGQGPRGASQSTRHADRPDQESA